MMAVTFDLGEPGVVPSGVRTGGKSSHVFGWHERQSSRTLFSMDDRLQPRHRVERRVRPDRRTGLDRRITDRRQRQIAVVVERRGRTERRSPMERRSVAGRRRLKDRRGSGLSLNDFTPS
ncbi:MAG: hypothetical protein ABR537_07405 [Gemmatimonadales bacterium]